MKRAKLLSFILAGSLLFQTAGIDAFATAPSESVPIEQTFEDTETSPSEQPAEEASDPDQSSDEEKDESGESGKTPAEEDTPDQPSEDENDGSEKTTDEEDTPDQPSEGESDKAAEESDISDQLSEEETDPAAEESESDDSISENTVSENTVSENTLSEDTLSTNESSLFSIFPGLGDNYQFSAQELADKRVLASHVGDVVQIQSMETATLADFQGVEGDYVSGEVVYLAETKEEAEQVAAAFGGTLDSYSYEVAVITLPKKATVALAVAAAAEPEIKLPAVWPNYYNYLHTDADTNTTISPLAPSDPNFTDQWQHDYIGTRYAWAAGYKGQGVNVAVIDTGLKTAHEDFGENAVTGRNFVDGANGTPQTTDNQTHGTHVAGIIAADDNEKGGVGIAPDAKVRGYCVFPADDGAASDDVMRAIAAAVKDGNEIINMSLGSPSYSLAYETVVKAAYDEGVAIFASSGNDDSNGNNYPAAYKYTISVGAVDENSTRAYFSNYGSTVNLSFPGVDILSTVPTGYDYMSGTSQASPAAAGTAAVILSSPKGAEIRKKSGKAKVDALLAAMKSSTTKCATSGMGAGTTYLPGVLKLATETTAPETPTITVVNEASLTRGANKKDYIAASVNVTIDCKSAMGLDIYYATDGKTPAYKNGAITNADNTAPYMLGTPITLSGAKSKTIKAIAVNPITGKVSKAATKTVTLTPIPTGVTVTPAGNVSRIVPGKSLKFTAAVAPAYAISNKVQWSVTDNTGNAVTTAQGITVSNGTVKTKATTPTGTYKVIATAVGNDGKKFDGKKGEYSFTVIASSNVTKVAFIDPSTKRAPKAKSIKTTDSKTTEENGSVLNLFSYLTVTTTDPSTKVKTDLTGTAALAEVVWSSSNAKVATVSDSGVITAVAPGKATIKATSNDSGNKSASYNVTVVQPVTGITIKGPVKVAAGKSITLTATVAPANAGNKKVVWAVKDGGAAVKVNAGGKVTTTKNAAGTYTITADAADKLGAATQATYTVTIANEEITSIKLNATKLTLFPPKTSATAKTAFALTPAVEGKAAGSKNKPTALTNPLIEWTSSAPAIASVDQTGMITAKAPGKATITCAATDGSGKKATCAVTVSAPMSKLVIAPTDGNEGDIAIGAKIKMAAKYYSNYGTPGSKKITWDICAYGNAALQDTVTIDKTGKLSVQKSLTLPNTGAYVYVQATAADGSGVQSNLYRIDIRKKCSKVELIWVDAIGGYMLFDTTDGKPNLNQFTTEKLVAELEKKAIPDYCTATISGSRNCGLSKSRVQLTDGGSIYAIYLPVPTKTTKKNPAYYTTWSTVRKECEKMTLTFKLKDGSNLKVKKIIYAVNYGNGSSYFD
ncbi:MAG: S8 family serine peptidase [Bacteroidales bacterium]|nr:S8 family serine peptidase [Bacteroidales bacterium]MCM1415757.1 S8 family serine peptidase [bacterium]MCM1424295.1 S8 family serine peptidase [bacterium]